jgi:hypothetical protein
VYCDPGGETLDITMSTAGNLDINVIASTDDDFATALSLFARHQDAPATGSFLVPVDGNSLAAYDVDDEVSRERMKATTPYMQGTLRLYGERGHHVRCLFPRVSKGDPSYEVFWNRFRLRTASLEHV